MAGVTYCALGLGVFALCGTSWILATLTEASAPIRASMVALPFGLAAAAIASLFVNGRRRKQTRLCRAALNNMTQGLCMFDSAARLVLCNQVYIDMYRLQPEHARPGTPLRDLLMHRLAVGTLREAVQGRTEAKNHRAFGRPRHRAGQPPDARRWLACHP